MFTHPSLHFSIGYYGVNTVRASKCRVLSRHIERRLNIHPTGKDSTLLEEEDVDVVTVLAAAAVAAQAILQFHSL